MVALIGITLFVIAFYLLLGKVIWFHRSEIRKSNKPAGGQVHYTPMMLVDYYTVGRLGYAPSDAKAGNEENMTIYSGSHSNEEQWIHFTVDYGFFKTRSLKNTAQTFKLLTYTEWTFHPHILVKTGRILQSFSSLP